ncbi:uncharacterized protein N7473_011359 [Penicillium subrubescens]|nr:uncharacterized protein N7473_011359 [Penicillium subrubescens]KAJ5880306.1 hypothetical protein N7473_011359 [Penicillium subrubescens]
MEEGGIMGKREENDEGGDGEEEKRMAMKRLQASKDEPLKRLEDAGTNLQENIHNPEMRKSVGGELAKGSIGLDRQLLTDFEAVDISVLPTDNLPRRLYKKSDGA